MKEGPELRTSIHLLTLSIKNSGNVSRCIVFGDAFADSGINYWGWHLINGVDYEMIFFRVELLNYS